MEVCPKCNQLMTWYMTYNCGKPYCGWHCYHCGYDTKAITYKNVASTTGGYVDAYTFDTDCSWKSGGSE